MYMLIQYAVLRYWPNFNHIQAYTCFQFSDYLIELSTCTTQWIQDYVYLILFQKYDKSFDTTFWLSDLMKCNTVDPRLCVFDIVFWYGIQIIWYGIQLQNHVRSQSGEQLINSIKSTCYILMTMMIYCNQWPLLLLTSSFQVLSIMTNLDEYLTSDNSDS